MSVLTPKNTPSCSALRITLHCNRRIKKRAWTITNYTVLLHGAALAYLELFDRPVHCLVKGSFSFSRSAKWIGDSFDRANGLPNIQNRDRQDNLRKHFGERINPIGENILVENPDARSLASRSMACNHNRDVCLFPLFHIQQTVTTITVHDLNLVRATLLRSEAPTASHRRISTECAPRARCDWTPLERIRVCINSPASVCPSDLKEDAAGDHELRTDERERFDRRSRSRI